MAAPKFMQTSLGGITYRCEWKEGGGRRCDQLASTFVVGEHRCSKHRPKGDPNCTHSLAPSGSCSYCGMPTP